MTQTTLQRVDLAPPLEIAELYRKEIGHDRDTRPIDVVDSALIIPTGGLVTFDTYFNAFFENYWFGYTNLASVDLSVAIDGDCVVSLWRQTPNFDRYLVRRTQHAGKGQVDFHVNHDEELRAEAGRLWFEIEALSDVTVRSAEWSSTDQPQRNVALGVVFCTFNREKYLQRILRALDQDDRALDAIERLFVINQGRPFTADEIVGPDSTGRLLTKLTVIEQPNMGGCGGFTRGMYETATDPNLTHFLLMDDDSRVNAESVARTAEFLGFCDENVAVGGHMLNLHRPNRLFEAGAMLDDSTLQPTPIHHDTDLTDGVGLEPFLRTGAVSYNGWWMFGAPASVLDDVGYPMPCFIRGDDMEYGVRLRNANFRTVPVPGIAVWHEPFYLKLGGWQFFYEVRNRLALAALHDHPNFGGIRKDLRRVFARDIAMCRYHSCKLMIEGIQAYTGGPQVALDTTDGPLRAAAAIVAEYGPEKVEETAYVQSKAEDRRNRGELRRMLDSAQESTRRKVGKVLLAGQVVRRVAIPERAGPANLPVLRAADLTPHGVANYDGYVVVEEHGGSAWRFQRNRTIEQALWREALPLFKQVEYDPRYQNEFEQTGKFEKTWRETFASLG